MLDHCTGTYRGATLEVVCFVLLGFLWIKIVRYSWIHKDKMELSTWSYVGDVIENEYLTLKQKQKNVATTKQEADSKQVCRNSKTNTTT
jgi:hypothetical protein